MKRRIHPVSGSVAILTILSFWSATLISELFLSVEAVAVVKRAILFGLLLLIPSLATTGGSGFSLAKAGNASIARKKRRMKIIALNGILFMLPLALYLNEKASVGEFDSHFYAAQAAELLIGAMQLFLLVMNFRDGLRWRGLEAV